VHVRVTNRSTRDIRLRQNQPGRRHGRGGIGSQTLRNSTAKSDQQISSRSSNAVEESYAFLELKQDQNKYILPDEIINVRELGRRTVGSRSESGQGGTLFEPFNLAYTNTYLLRAGAAGGLATYYAFASYQELVGKMFGSFIQFHYDNATKTLTITQKPRIDTEVVIMHTDNYRPDITLFKDIYSKPWIRDYTLAVCKTMLGEARGKFNTIAGPQGGTTLNGDALKQAGQAEMERLDQEINNYLEGGTPYSFVIG
jgi:hypothetical protein